MSEENNNFVKIIHLCQRAGRHESSENFIAAAECFAEAAALLIKSGYNERWHPVIERAEAAFYAHGDIELGAQFYENLGAIYEDPDSKAVYFNKAAACYRETENRDGAKRNLINLVECQGSVFAYSLKREALKQLLEVYGEDGNTEEKLGYKVIYDALESSHDSNNGQYDTIDANSSPLNTLEKLMNAGTPKGFIASELQHATQLYLNKKVYNSAGFCYEVLAELGSSHKKIINLKRACNSYELQEDWERVGFCLIRWAGFITDVPRKIMNLTLSASSFSATQNYPMLNACLLGIDALACQLKLNTVIERIQIEGVKFQNSVNSGNGNEISRVAHAKAAACFETEAMLRGVSEPGISALRKSALCYVQAGQKDKADELYRQETNWREIPFSKPGGRGRVAP